MEKKILLQDLADGIARRRNIHKKDAEVFVRSVFEIVSEYLQSDKIVKIKGLGTFKLVTVDSRESVDVNTGERIVIKEYTKVNFTPDSVLRDTINKPFAQFETVVLYEGTKVEDMERMDAPVEIKTVDTSTWASTIESVAIDDNEGPDGERLPEGDVGKEESFVEESADAIPNEEIVEVASSEEDVVATDTLNETVVDDNTNTIVEDDIHGEEEIVDLPDYIEEKECSKRIRDIHVEKQQIEVQNVEHQTVENQHIVQMASDNGKRRVYLTPWMIFFIILLVIFLMGISYYAGSQHLFASLCGRDVVVEPQSVTSIKLQTADEYIPLEVDSIKIDTLKNSITEEESLMVNKELTKSDTTKDSVRVEVYPQVPDGEYEIVGVMAEHRLKNGETLRGLALKYYGSKNYVIYIIAMNPMENPDVVPKGKLLRIPELKTKAR